MRRPLLGLAFLLSIATFSSAQLWVINTVAGGGPNNLPATGAAIGQSNGLAVDGAGNVYVSTNAYANSVLEVTGGQISRVAGAGNETFSLTYDAVGAGGPATQAVFQGPAAIGVDGAGDIFIPDVAGYVWKVDTTGIVTTIAGTGQGINNAGQCVFDGDGPALQHSLCRPVQAVVDGSGNVFVSDAGNYRVRKIDTQGNMTTVAGDGPNLYGKCVYGGDGLATSQSVCPAGIELDAKGNLYIADPTSERVFKVDTSGNMATIAGDGNAIFSGDGGPALSAGMNPTSVALDGAGNVYIVDFINNRLRKIDTNGNISTVAGNGTNSCTWNESGPATQEGVCGGWVAADTAGNLYVNDPQLFVVDRIDTSGNLTPFAGNGQIEDITNGISATQYSVYYPTSVATDPSGTVYFDEAGIRTIASNGTMSWVLEGIAGSLSAVDAVGNIYWVSSNQVGRWDTSGNSTVLAGTTQCTFDGDGPATSHSVCRPTGLAVDSSGNIFIADTNNCRVRKVDTNGNMTTIAGPTALIQSPCGFNGDGPATSYELNLPQAVAVDGAGNVYVADTANDRVRVISAADSTLTTIAGSGMLLSGQCVFDGDGPATQHSLCSPNSVAVDSSGDVFVLDPGNVRVRMISGRNMTTLAGNGKSSFAGENAPASTAVFDNPAAISADPSGNIYVADKYNNRIREISPTSAFIVSAGQPTLTLTVGDSGMVTLQVTAANGFSGTVSFTCSGAPQGATCTPSPSSQPVSGGSASTTYTITTTAGTTGASEIPARPRTPVWWLLGLILAIAAASSRPKRRLALGLAVGMLVLMPACGGGGSSGGGGGGVNPTPKGSYILTLSAASGSTTQSAMVKLKVQ